MPEVKISEYSATANSNTDVASINIDEGCAPSGINNAIRAVMGHLKDFQQGTYGDPFNGPHNGTVGATTPSTGAFTTLTASSTATLNTLVSSGATLTGGTINGMTVGATTPATGAFTTVSATGLINGGAIQTSGTATGSFSASKWFIQSEDSTTVRSYACGPDASTAGRWEHYVANSTGAPSLAQRWNADANIAVRNIGVGLATPTTSGTGITFPATQSASSDANTLDDYEEGTWTATLVSSGGGSVTLTSSAQYTKVGNLVFVSVENFSISLTSLSAGNLTITGLPFTCNANSPSLAYFDIAGAVTASSGSVVAYAAGSTTIQLLKTESTTSALASLAKSDLNSSISLRFNGTYTV